ncbi:hypothetical protein TNIN_28771 [Trichonephila inaurata madagascariensis]|uniref:Uncharacterized protein n=1 Tax=Trichonephila inaurata madagascariensis TaxID=2747483 RepID=A0A8X7C8V6_9ARAC|nr:hypothetical protein TNIN_28771 [Trichonephila inaurata madagascariensis]
MFVVGWALLVLTVLVRPSENAVPPKIHAEIPMPKAPEEKDLYIGAIFPINGTGGWPPRPGMSASGPHGPGRCQCRTQFVARVQDEDALQ